MERSARQELEREIVLLKERLDGSQRALEATRAELDLRDARLSELDRELRTSTHTVHTHSTQYTRFLEQLAALLSDVEGSVYASEEDVRRKIETLIILARDFRGVSSLQLWHWFNLFLLTLLHSERPKLYTILTFFSAVGLIKPEMLG